MPEEKFTFCDQLKKREKKFSGNFVTKSCEFRFRKTEDEK